MLKHREISVRNAKHLYELYGVIVHYGTSIARGHYACVVKNSNGLWYDMDDDVVSSVKLKTVGALLLLCFVFLFLLFFFSFSFRIFFCLFNSDRSRTSYVFPSFCCCCVLLRC